MPKIQEFPPGLLTEAIQKELVNGWKMEEACGMIRERKGAAEAREMRGHKSIDGLGKCVGTVPEEDYFRIVAKYGPEFFQDKGNVRQFFNRHPHLKSNNL